MTLNIDQIQAPLDIERNSEYLRIFKKTLREDLKNIDDIAQDSLAQLSETLSLEILVLKRQIEEQKNQRPSVYCKAGSGIAAGAIPFLAGIAADASDSTKIPLVLVGAVVSLSSFIWGYIRRTRQIDRIVNIYIQITAKRQLIAHIAALPCPKQPMTEPELRKYLGDLKKELQKTNNRIERDKEKQGLTPSAQGLLTMAIKANEKKATELNDQIKVVREELIELEAKARQPQMTLLQTAEMYEKIKEEPIEKKYELDIEEDQLSGDPMLLQLRAFMSDPNKK
jgi:hypothetical protein